MAAQAELVLQTLQLMPSHPSLQLHCFPLRGRRLEPSASEPQRGRVQSSPPKPEGQAHLPDDLVQLANWWQTKSSRLQLKQGGQSLGRLSEMERKSWEGRRSAGVV